MEPLFFPRWANPIFVAGAGLAVLAPVYVLLLLFTGLSSGATDVGYAPVQPVPFSHQLHAGTLGMDCRYCHNTVEVAAHSAVPPTETCMNCHKTIHAESEKLLPVREGYAANRPIAWVRVHDLPDFVYFDHSAHVRRGVGCVSCHGRIDTMEVVRQMEPLTMGWCLACHREPEPFLRPDERITDMAWKPEGDPALLGAKIRKDRNINPSTDCSTCHR